MNSYNDQAVREGIWRQMPGLNEGMGRRKIVEINVEDVEKRKDPSKHYVGISVKQHNYACTGVSLLGFR